MRKEFPRTFVVGCCLLGTCEVDHADILVAPGPNAAGSFSVNLNSIVAPTELTGNPTASGAENLVLDFLADTNIASSGNNIVGSPSPSRFNSLTISSADGSAYSRLLFMPNNAANVCPGCNLNAPVTVSVIAAVPSGTNDSGQTTYTLEPAETFTISAGTGNANTWEIFGTNNVNNPNPLGPELIASVTIQAPGGIGVVNNIRTGGTLAVPGTVPPPICATNRELSECQVPTPEPDTLPLLGFGLTGFGLCFRKLRRRCD